MRVTNIYEIYLFTASYIVSWNHNALSHWPIGVIGVFIIQLHKVEYNNARIEYKYLSILYLFYKGIITKINGSISCFIVLLIVSLMWMRHDSSFQLEYKYSAASKITWRPRTIVIFSPLNTTWSALGRDGK